MRPREVETARRAILRNSHTERCCGMIVAPVLLKNITRVTLLLIYVLLIAIASYGVT